MTVNEAKKVIIDTIIELVGVDDEITEEMSLVRDLGVSSMKLLTMIGELEDIFDIDLDIKKMGNISTIGELCDYIIAQL